MTPKKQMKGKDKKTPAPAKPAQTLFDLDSLRQRVVAELPEKLRWFMQETPWDFDFSRAKSPLRTISAEEILGEPETRWQNLWVFGEDDQSEGGGAAWFYAIDGRSGYIHGIDLEEDETIFLWNSNLDAFIRTFQIFDEAMRLRRFTLTEAARCAQDIDKQAFPRSKWRELANYLLHHAEYEDRDECLALTGSLDRLAPDL